jgi:hypothetical protein
MASLENDDSKKQMTGNNAREEANIYEDEISLISSFFILWKRKWLILLVTIFPTLLVGIALLVYPRTYKVTYVYDVSNWNINEKTYRVLCSRFYSEANLNRIIDKLQKNKLDKYAEQLRKASYYGVKKIVKLEVSPPFIDIYGLKLTNPDQLKKLRDMKAFLLDMTMTGKPLEDLGKMALIMRDNFEEVAPLYMIQEQLSTDIRGYNSKLAEIESSKFGLELALKNNSEILAALKKIDVTTLDKKEGEIVLQFDVGGRSQYLPLSYQIQAIESKIVELKGKLKADAANHKYYKDLLTLDAKVLTELNAKLAAGNGYTINLFKLFLIDLVGEYEKPELKDYLASYIKKIENRISVGIPVSKNPRVYPVAKGIVKKTSFIFAIALLMSIFASFLLEGIKNKKRQSLVS